jgi:signal transduction histidine kinase
VTEGDASDRVNVLLVDDQPSRLLAYEAVLGELGENLVKASSGEEALRRLIRDEFAVVLLDVSMPGMDGYETATLMRSHPRVATTPIIFVTAFSVSEMDRLRGYELGAVDYVYVPIVPAILRGKVSVLAELHRRRRELQRLNKSLAQANEELAAANAALSAERERDLHRVNRMLKKVNARLAKSNASLKAEMDERNRLDAALREADRRKDEFLAVLAHELRNPLAPILNAVSVLRAQVRAPGELEYCRDVIERQVQHLARLVDDVLDVARFTQGKFEMRPEAVDLQTIVARAVEASRPFLDAASQSLTVSLPDEAVALSADAVRMVQVLSNLLHNAAKYGGTGGKVSVAAEVRTADDGASREVEIRVTDGGIGIAPDVLPHVFEPFVQADRSIARAKGGLGIGLTLVKRIVELHGGTVEARSEGLGRGSEFVVRIPVRASTLPADAEERPDADGRPRRKRRVLVVDDNGPSADSMSILLRKMGHEVATAYDGEDAVETARTFRPDLALLDIGLPVIDGYEVARRIRRQPGGESVALVALTGWGLEEDRRRSREAGFDRHVVKPVDRATLERVLESSREEQTLGACRPADGAATNS